MGTHGSQQASLRKSCPRNGHKTEGFKKITTWYDKNVSVSSTIVEAWAPVLWLRWPTCTRIYLPSSMVDHSLWKMASQLKIAFLVPNVRKSCHVARDGLSYSQNTVCTCQTKAIWGSYPIYTLAFPFCQQK